MPEECPTPRAPTSADLAFVSGRALAIVDEGISSLEDASEIARRDRDIVWLTCLEDRRMQLRAIRASLSARALASPDDDASLARAVEVARAMCEEAREVQISARECVATDPDSP